MSATVCNLKQTFLPPTRSTCLPSLGSHALSGSFSGGRRFPKDTFTPQYSTSLTFGRCRGIWDWEANSETSWNKRSR